MTLFRIAVTLCVALLCGSGTVAAADVTSVTIVDTPRPEPKWGFAPTSRTIQAGSWVTWSNDGQDTHTVTAVDGKFDSGDLYPSEGYSWYFDAPGRFPYVCSLHPWMTGTIIVGKPATVSPEPSAVSPEPSAVSSQPSGVDSPSDDDQSPVDDAAPGTN